MQSVYLAIRFYISNMQVIFEMQYNVRHGLRQLSIKHQQFVNALVKKKKRLGLVGRKLTSQQQVPNQGGSRKTTVDIQRMSEQSRRCVVRLIRKTLSPLGEGIGSVGYFIDCARRFGLQVQSSTHSGDDCRSIADLEEPINTI